jgi:serine/threonine-protein kinase
MFKPLSDLVKSFSKESNQLLAKRYEIVHKVGQGAMGQVFKAKDKNSGDLIVAIKFLSNAIVSNEKMRGIFEKEARVSALLGEQSNHIVKVRDYGFDENKVPYYVMEFLDGYDLSQLMKKKALSVGKFLSLTNQICLGLECAHNGILVNGELAPIIHRDIKPSNIFLVKDKDNNVEHYVKLLDFGIAQINDSDQGQTQQRFMGTPEYCSPEQLAEEELHPTSDIYTLGVLMYKMLTQRSPITVVEHSIQAWYQAHHESIPSKFPSYINLPKELENIIMKCLEKSPANRPQSINEILRVIAPLDREYNQLKSSVSDTPSGNLKSEQKSASLLSLEKVYSQSTWPSNKPQKKIVFPNLVQTPEGSFPTVWTMLEPEEIDYFKQNKAVYLDHFLFLLEPHPMVLWINLLYNRQYEPKWLPCYLDLKTEIGYQIIFNLINHRFYHILLFALEKPKKYQELLKININEEKFKQLQTFLLKSASWQGQKQPEATRILLKKQFESIKGNILQIVNK